MRKRPRLTVLHLALVSGTLLGSACATPTYGAGEAACPESQAACLSVDSDCTVDAQRHCVLCICGQRQRITAKDGVHGSLH